jgi:uncharacterized membrane protein
VAALAYILLPVSGAFAFFVAQSRRVRFHGLQAIAYGVVWPLLLYLSSALSSTATIVVAAVGALGWVALMALTAIGTDPKVPGVERLFELSEGGR